MEIFGRYVLIERIGMGGMAEVYRAVSVGSAGFTRPVAVKRILPNLTQNAAVTHMLVEEAKLAASLSHPNIIRVLDLGEQGQTYFIAMDYVPGRTLTQTMIRARERKERLPLAFAMYVARQALRGLAHAHKKTDPLGVPMGIIHRDISPDNVMVSFDGHVFLMDFGIARAADQVRLTLAGSLKGRPAYMSPEVVRGEPVTQDVDLFAMGVVMHELMTLQPMRLPKSDIQMLSDVAKGGFPTLASRGAKVPTQVEQVICRALQDNPAERFPDADTFGRAVEDVQLELGLRFGPEDLSAFLASVFPDELRQEQEVQANLQKLIKRLRHASPRKVARIVAEAKGERLPWWVLSGRSAAVALASLLVAAGTGALWLGFRPGPGPAPAQQPEQAVQNETPPLQPRTVTVRVTSTPPGARVQINNANVGDTPVDITLRPGESGALKVEKLGFQSFYRQLTFDSAPPEVWAELTPLERKPTARGPGLLSLQTKPWGRVFVDGKDTGKFTPITKMELPSGRHEVVVTNDKLGISTRFTLVVESGRHHKESRTLR